MILAHKTLTAINDALKKDQGARYREILGKIILTAKDAFDPSNVKWRNHLGASLIGRECSRELWYSFHWATLPQFDGRLLRLFNRGHLEEPRCVALLMQFAQFWQHDADGKQFRIKDAYGHFGGSLDGVVLGLPDLPGVPALAEFKTHNAKSFESVALLGVMASKWEHFVQQQLYMGKMELEWSLYMAVNKNNDDLHLELVHFDSTIYEKYRTRAFEIVLATTPPPKLNKNPSWYKCKFCDQRPVCHMKATPERNCRTCVHSQLGPEGTWLCTEERNNAAFGDNPELSPEDQRIGCDHYQINPAFGED